MKCKACNSEVTPRWNSQISDWELCSTCLVWVREYLDGFKWSSSITYTDQPYQYKVTVNGKEQRSS